MRGEVQRWTSILVGAVVVVFAAWLAFSQAERRPARGGVDGAFDGSVSSATAGPVIAVTPPTALNAADARDGGSMLSLAFFDGGSTMPNGAPRAVKLGIVMIQFQGAEGASSSARSKTDALAFAQTVAATAKTDFKRAVKDGDGGSGENLGSFPRGVLDPRTEVAVFSLSAGDVSEPLETPRGYWIVKRVE